MLTLPPKVTDRAFERLAEIGAQAQGKSLRVAVEAAGVLAFNMRSRWMRQSLMIWSCQVMVKPL